MKKTTLLFLVLFLGVSLGCTDTRQQVIEGNEETGGYPVVSAPASSSAVTEQPSPYPLPEQVKGSNDQAAGEMYPSPSETVDEEPMATTGSITPTAHVDVAMRATDPEAFVLASGKVQLVEFFAFWCPTCKSIAPTLKNLENRYSGTIQFVYLDIDDPRTNSYKQALGYLYQPHIFLIDGEGKILQQWVGYVTEDELDAVLRSIQ
ncbi:MAG: hypothetical protein Kow0088_06610 [Anaerolineales bacterium]